MIVLEPKPEALRVNFVVMVRAVLRALHLKLARRNWHYRFHKLLYRTYLLETLISLRPRAVITVIHNSPLFWWMANHHAGCEYIQIANGIDFPKNLTSDISFVGSDLRNVSATAYCFGQQDVDLYARHQFRFAQMLPVGSLKSDIYKHTKAKTEATIFDFCLVSQWTEFGSNSKSSSIMRSMDVLATHLAQYLADREVTCCVMLRSGSEEERAHARQFFGDCCAYRFTDDTFDGYRTIDSSAIVISFCSSLAYEGYSWGKRVLFGNPLQLPEYQMPLPCELVVGSTEFSEFETKLNALTQMNAQDYDNLSISNRQYLVTHNKEAPSFALVRKHVDRIMLKKT